MCFIHDAFQFKKISEAYQILSDPALRKRYNEFGEENGVRPDGGFGINKTIKVYHEQALIPLNDCFFLVYIYIYI